ncbi:MULTISPECIES: WecB/TagA/CpsF family glycosyltransferase [Bradyrhizobium]|uniref:Glycosyltransferase n=1 Tax=Bradyrhizobium ottawaense TaxID=931866 RepID=A0A2U8PGR1_9BRAD|nr:MULTISPECIES: WecB/TagA/CpsF family glycosyltransferase [Bradyrhizobium]AWL96953.1 glycosyltransferase [Bradyrhizobium ottawaense]MBR1293794.1 WecB/TagA/CpsF family glycosyltransferase [Bradyrhizobium ottawaense]MBR1330401.1 WecB/TagA/CpsF family glycosyltransferase [Bradyrhizobium ottawaense]MBR1335852.1 WecB/TagA/CpsF family glycosyltransferase [Bradyrhizobium ottawaense]MBR1363727.1 WecB/TagA/CpsF family glycosyltransferase [Bradyrhizobium ottawaense]
MRASFLACPIDLLTMAETVELARGAMRCRRRLQHVALNVAKFVNMRSDPMLAADVANSDIVSIDGMGILWGARALGLPATSRVAGVDLLAELLAVCAREGYKPYFLGATPAVLQQAMQRARERYPSLVFAGWHDGYFKPEQEREVVRDIQSSAADCLFIGMPTPRKERFLAAHRDELGVPFIMGVGGAFDILAGTVRRAPARIQGLGLEWLYRIYQEPGRMWWRYATTNTLFAGILLQALAKQAIGHTFGTPGAVPPGPSRIGG